MILQLLSFYPLYNAIQFVLYCCGFIISVTLNTKALNKNIFLVYSWLLDEYLSRFPEFRCDRFSAYRLTVFYSYFRR